VLIPQRAIHAAFDTDEVKARLKDNAWYPEAFTNKNQFTTMAMLEMLTGLKTEYIFRNWGSDYPVIKPSEKENSKEYEQDWTSDDKATAFQDWMLGPKHTQPTPNWNPTVMLSKDKVIRALKPVAEDHSGISFKEVYLQTPTSTTSPYYNKEGKGAEKEGMFDKKIEYGKIWSSDWGDTMVWIARLKIDIGNMAPLSAAPKAVGNAIGKSGYFKLEDSMIGGA
jgi:hypothetical protein